MLNCGAWGVSAVEFEYCILESLGALVKLDRAVLGCDENDALEKDRLKDGNFCED